MKHLFIKVDNSMSGAKSLVKCFWQNKFYWPGTCPNNFLFTVFLFNITKFLALCPDQIIDKKILSDSVENIFPHNTKNNWHQKYLFKVATIARPPVDPAHKRPSTDYTGYIICIYQVFKGDDGEKFERNWLYWTGAHEDVIIVWNELCLIHRSSNAVQKPSPKCWSAPPDAAQVRYRPQRQLHPSSGVQPLFGQHQPGLRHFLENQWCQTFLLILIMMPTFSRLPICCRCCVRGYAATLASSG